MQCTNGNGIVVCTTEELVSLPRLPGASRDMIDAEITVTALSDPDTFPPLETEMAAVGKAGGARPLPNCSRWKK